MGFPDLSAYAEVRSLRFYEQRVEKADQGPLHSTRLFAPHRRRHLKFPQARMQSRSSQWFFPHSTQWNSAFQVSLKPVLSWYGTTVTTLRIVA